MPSTSFSEPAGATSAHTLLRARTKFRNPIVAEAPYYLRLGGKSQLKSTQR